MKIKLTQSILLLAIILMSATCGESEQARKEREDKEKKEQAEKSVKEYLEAIKNHKFEEAKVKVSPEFQPNINIIIEEEKKYREFNNQSLPITYEIIEKIIDKDKVKCKTKIVIGKVAKEELIELVLVKDKWLVLCPPTQLIVLRSIVFYNVYDVIVIRHQQKYRIIEVEGHHKHKKKHHPHGKAHGYHKNHEDKD